jgi:zinc transport system substrate-binding protein
LLLFFLGLGLMPVVAGPAAAPAPPKLYVLTSFLPIYCFAANVAGNAATVENLLPPGSGPHDYQFTPRDLQRLSRARILFVNGLGAEDWLATALKIKRPEPEIVTVTRGIEPYLLYGNPARPAAAMDRAPTETANPHVWLDPQLAAVAVSNILHAFERADPARAQEYQTNAARYLARLSALDQEIADGLRGLTNRSLVTLHHAFPYFTRRYELQLVGVIEEVPDVGPAPKDLARLLQKIREHRVPTIFTETQFSDRLAKQLARDLKVQVAALDALETGQLTPNAYEEGMRRNLAVLKQNLN